MSAISWGMPGSLSSRTVGLKASLLVLQMQPGCAAFANDEQIALGIEGESLGLKTDVTSQLGELGVADGHKAPGADRLAPNGWVVKPRAHS